MKFSKIVFCVYVCTLFISKISQIQGNESEEIVNDNSTTTILSNVIKQHTKTTDNKNVINNGTNNDNVDIDLLINISRNKLPSLSDSRNNNSVVDINSIDDNIEKYFKSAVVMEGDKDIESLFYDDSNDDITVNDNNDITVKKINDISNKEIEDKIAIDTLLGIFALPPNLSVWELFKAQVRADVAPFLIIIPRPIKKMIAKHFTTYGGKLKAVLQGAMFPM